MDRVTVAHVAQEKAAGRAARFTFHASLAGPFGSLLQRSRVVDSRKTGSDQPNLIARLRTPSVTRNPAIIAS